MLTRRDSHFLIIFKVGESNRPDNIRPMLSGLLAFLPFASFASLADNNSTFPTTHDSKSKVVSINGITNPAIFSVFCVLCGLFKIVQ